MAAKPRFDGQPLVDAYGDGGFRLAGQRFEGSIIVTPLGLYPWAPKSLAGVTPGSVAPLIEASADFDFLIVGAGEILTRLPDAARQRLESAGLFADLMPTSPACRTYNLMLSENRRVAAAFIAVG